MSDVKLARTIQRFQAKIDSGSYYEAHQTLRTITNRYIKANQSEEAINLLYEGSIILSKHKQYASSSDLILYLISIYKQFNIVGGEYKGKLIELINSIPNQETNNLLDISKQSIEWSRSDINKFGDNELHNVFGIKLLKSIQEDDEDVKDEKDNINESDKVINNEEEKYKLFTIAELHLILGTYTSVPVYVNYLYQWFESTEGDGVDAGLFLSRAIINYGYLKNLKFVKESRDLFINQLIKTHTDYEIIEENDNKIYYFKSYPLLNFLQLLIFTIEKENSSNKFLKLYDQYKSVLKTYEILTSIEYFGKIYFNLKLGSTNNQGNILSSLMGDLFK
ncbi:hypothetical protein DFJ63DRAFT_23676 [Scheffersomyces coipomensis]|uniref:uncharacterized protein n=1 Tax=Scheffersomyces coipomensis TaxID=1788519 RepID=UPI00315C6206